MGIDLGKRWGQMYRRGFLFLMWGFLFVLFDLHIQTVNLLPDFIGYILCIIGLSDLRQTSDFFNRAYYWSFVLLILSLPKVLGVNFSVTTTNPGMTLSRAPMLAGIAGLAMLLFIVNFVLQLLWVFWILQGIKELASQRGNFALEDAADFRWKLYAASVVYNLIVMLVAFAITPLVVPFILIGFVLGMIVTIVFMTLMYRCANELS